MAKKSLGKSKSYDPEKSSKEWRNLQAHHPDNPALKQEAVYVLPHELIRAIQLEIPTFFNKQELAFEADLASTDAAGFYLGQPFDYVPVMSVAKREARIGNHIDHVSEVLRPHIESPVALKKILESVKKADQIMNQHANAYSGWLVTNPLFSTDIALSVRVFRTRILAAGGFPLYPSSGPIPVKDSDEVEHAWKGMFDFYDRWSLRSMETWDLPSPIVPNSVGGINLQEQGLENAGLKIFIPWYLLRSKLNISDFAEPFLLAGTVKRLANWINRLPKHLGRPPRLERRLRLYFFVELALRRRYYDRLENNSERLNFALARFWSIYYPGKRELDVESFRKERQLLSRLLKKTKDLGDLNHLVGFLS